MARQRKQVANATLTTLPEPPVKTELQSGAEATVDTTDQQQGRDTANQLLGRIQYGQGLAKLVTVTTLMDLKKVKENKSYKHLLAKGADGKSVTVTTWEQFCNQLGVSREKIDKDLLNLETFGAEALESMQQMGLGYRQLRQLRKLPVEDRNAVVEEVEADLGDKDAILSLIDELSVKHKKEADALSTRAERAEQDLAANERVLDDKAKQITKLEKELAKATSSKEPLNVDEQIKLQCSELDSIGRELEMGGTHSVFVLRAVIDRLFAAYDNQPPKEVVQAAGLATYNSYKAIRNLADTYQLWNAIDDAEPDNDDEWMPNMEVNND